MCVMKETGKERGEREKEEQENKAESALAGSEATNRRSTPPASLARSFGGHNRASAPIMCFCRFPPCVEGAAVVPGSCRWRCRIFILLLLVRGQLLLLLFFLQPRPDSSATGTRWVESCDNATTPDVHAAIHFVDRVLLVGFPPHQGRRRREMSFPHLVRSAPAVELLVQVRPFRAAGLPAGIRSSRLIQGVFRTSR